ncbi:hypothetical protein GmHk_19G053967 [Glycine max]|nr:hypothetical protein GmHk_19G053967 [Glycine max]
MHYKAEALEHMKKRDTGHQSVSLENKTGDSTVLKIGDSAKVVMKQDMKGRKHKYGFNNNKREKTEKKRVVDDETGDKHDLLFVSLTHMMGVDDEMVSKLQILQKVKEEKQRISCGSPAHSHVNIDSQCSADKFPVMDGKVQSETPCQEIPSIASSLNYTHSNQSGSIDQCSRPSEGVIESGSSASAVYSNLKLDLSMSDGEICLDKLSIRELHELFKVTFGRETTVKDKQWLKRRIAMSLTNSCDVSATTFIIKNNKIVRKFEEESSGNMNAGSLISSGNMTEEEDVNFKDSSAVNACGIEDNQVVSETRPKIGLEDENYQTGQRAAKTNCMNIVGGIEAYLEGGFLCSSYMDFQPLKLMFQEFKDKLIELVNLLFMRIVQVAITIYKTSL